MLHFPKMISQGIEHSSKKVELPVNISDQCPTLGLEVKRDDDAATASKPAALGM
jgi:hypothetical protein